MVPDGGSPDAVAPDSSAPPPDVAPQPDAAPPVCTNGSGVFPRALNLPVIGPNGAFDPSFARNPDDDRLWMSYTMVDGPVGGDAKVGVHLAYSDDNGDTWCYQGLVVDAMTVPEAEQPEAIAQPNGHWNHEMSALAYDPAAPADKRWVLIWQRYLHIVDDIPANEDRHFEHGWTAIRTAGSPQELMSADESTLFSASLYHLNDSIESYNDAVGGVPIKRWDQDPDLGGCLAFAEPGMIAANGKLYIVLFCFRSIDAQDIVLVERDAGEWSYSATLRTTADAKDISDSLVGFNGADLAKVGGEHRLLVSPTDGLAYLGCIEYGIDLESGTLNPNALSAQAASTSADVAFSGACAYDDESNLGLVIGHIHGTGVNFQLQATGNALTAPE